MYVILYLIIYFNSFFLNCLNTKILEYKMQENTLDFTNFLYFFYFVMLSLFICFFMLFAGWFLGGRSLSRYKNTPFESGIVPIGNTNLHFSIKFYFVAMCFVIFDVEALYLYTWSINITELGWTGFSEAIIFIFFLFLSLFYLIRIKALD